MNCMCSKWLFFIYGVQCIHCNLTEGLKRTRRKSLNEIWTELTTGFCQSIFISFSPIWLDSVWWQRSRISAYHQMQFASMCTCSSLHTAHSTAVYVQCNIFMFNVCIVATGVCLCMHSLIRMLLSHRYTHSLALYHFVHSVLDLVYNTLNAIGK